MGFFQNKAFNLIYIHGALQAIAAHGGETFAFVYLLKVGISVPVVLACIGLMFASRLLFRKLVLPLALRVGLRNAFIFGIVLEAATYPLLAHITEFGPLLVFYLALWAISSSIYWTTYHAYVARIGDNTHGGKQVSGLEFIGTIVGIIAPITTGLMLTYIGPLFAFSVIGLAMASSGLPILLGPNLKVDTEVEMPRLRTAWWAMFSDGARAGSFHFTWLIALFITLNASYTAFGGTLALAGVAGAVMGLFVGRSIDLGNGKSALKVGLSILAVAIACRAFGYGAVWSAVLANAAAAVAWPAYATAFNSRIYVLARQTACTLRFHVVAEGGWDAGVAVACLLAALLTVLGFSFFWILISALLGCVLAYVILAPTYDTPTSPPGITREVPSS
jgi:MFS transporter, DHA1 family, inner membrane transport protein